MSVDLPYSFHRPNARIFVSLTRPRSPRVRSPRIRVQPRPVTRGVVTPISRTNPSHRIARRLASPTYVIDVRDHRHVTDILVVIHLLAQLIDGKLSRENARQSRVRRVARSRVIIPRARSRARARPRRARGARDARIASKHSRTFTMASDRAASLRRRRARAARRVTARRATATAASECRKVRVFCVTRCRATRARRARDGDAGERGRTSRAVGDARGRAMVQNARLSRDARAAVRKERTNQMRKTARRREATDRRSTRASSTRAMWDGESPTGT